MDFPLFSSFFSAPSNFIDVFSDFFFCLFGVCSLRLALFESERKLHGDCLDRFIDDWLQRRRCRDVEVVRNFATTLRLFRIEWFAAPSTASRLQFSISNMNHYVVSV